MWIRAGEVFRKLSGTVVTEEGLQPGIYTIDFDISGPKLTRIAKEFNFNHEIFNTKEKFISWAIKSYKNDPDGFGILLSGIKGTGKSITSKLICNRLGLPVILVSDNSKQVIDFIQTIEDEVVFFIDEFEKTFGHYDPEEGEYGADKLLPIMDGASSLGKKLWIMTTNDENVNSFLLDRPKRVRYHLRFGELSKDDIQEIVDKTLENKVWESDIFDVMDTADVSSVDVLLELIKEVNFHNESPKEFVDFFNVSKRKAVILYKIEADGSETFVGPNPNYNCFDDYMVGAKIFCDGKYVGTVRSVDEDGIGILEKGKSKSQYIIRRDVYTRLW